MRSNSMRKFLIFVSVLLVCFMVLYFLYFNTNFYFKFSTPEVKTFMKTDAEKIYMLKDGQYTEFKITGVNIGAGIPGHFATDYAITKEQYLSWFEDIQKMGANTIRVYTIHAPAFYEAVYEYNSDNPDPLYIIHGLWLNDYAHFSHRDAYDKDILGQLKSDACLLVDVIWGQRHVNLGAEAGTGNYNYNISQWVIGYILGVEWEEYTVAYTDLKYEGLRNIYNGQYMYTSAEASPFEAMLAQLGDKIIKYETERYGTQRLVAFSNWPTTDPFEYSEAVTKVMSKATKVDVEHILTTDQFQSGTFASYHVYPYFPDFLSYEEGLDTRTDPYGDVNTYYAYLRMLTDHHQQPVVIAEYGIPASRGMARIGLYPGRNQGYLTEEEQAEAVAGCYRDILDAGCAGSILFEWQDEWFKRTWNTKPNVDLKEAPYWSDYQTNEQSFGVLAFDPGVDESICYVDGDISEWENDQPLFSTDDLSLAAKYDEKFLYFMIKAENISEENTLYIPLDVTPKTGALSCNRYNLAFDSPMDFVIKIGGSGEDRIVVQQRYNVLRATSAFETLGINAYIIPPDIDTAEFDNIEFILHGKSDSRALEAVESIDLFEAYDDLSEVYETGRLLEGNGNPSSPEFNSLTDYSYGEVCIEIDNLDVCPES